MPGASVYFRREVAYVQTTSDSFGLSMGDGTPAVLSKPFEATTLGKSVHDATLRSRSELPREFKRPNELVRVSGAKTWAQFAKQSILVTVDLKEGGKHVLDVWTVVDNRGGMEPHPAFTVELHAPTDEQLGAAVLEQWKKGSGDSA